MIRRDKFIQELSKINSGAYLETKVSELETYVDAQLVEFSNMLLMINSNVQGTYSTAGVEYVSGFEPTYAVHADSSRIKLATAGTTGFGNKIWSDELIYIQGGSAVNAPWTDLTTDPNFNGSLKIELPSDTNKNVAQLLAWKYQNMDVRGNTPLGGHWGSSNVVVTHDRNANKLYITFKLF